MEFRKSARMKMFYPWIGSLVAIILKRIPKFGVYTDFSIFCTDFYFPHMKYGKVLVSLPKNQKKKIAFFHVLGLIIPNNMFRAKKKIRLSRGVAAAAVDRICRVDFSVTLRDRELKFLTQLWFGLKLCMPFLEF
jgi:hypothetical protein